MHLVDFIEILAARMAVRYASIFSEKYGALVRYAFFVMVRVRYVGALFELKITDFSHIVKAFCMQRQKTAEATLYVLIEIADL